MDKTTASQTSDAPKRASTSSSIDLTQYIDCLSGELDIRFSAVGARDPSKYTSVGSGSFTTCTSSQASFSGTVDIQLTKKLKYSGDIDGTIDVSASTVVLQGETFDAQISEDGDYLRVEFTASGWDVVVWIQQWDSGTYVRVDVSVLSPRFWLGVSS